ADIHECGAAVFAYGWNPDANERATETLFRHVLEAEPQYAGRLYGPDEAVQEAMRRTQHASRPMLLADTQDNPGAGGSADTVGLLEAMLRQRAEGAVIGILHDPEAARAAHATGRGRTVTVGVGAKSGAWGERPVVRSWTVERLGDGRMTCRG